MEYSDSIQIRRVQALQGERSLTLVLPKDFAIALEIGKGDYLKCAVEGQKLIIQKVDS
jgi:bifunctional DNA-binding transcriptional regulator/antitoxin component of YhaV-PrlF toxin-antitoxin module